MKRLRFNLPLFVLLLVVVSTSVLAQQKVQINALFPPNGPGNKLWSDFNQYVLKDPLIDGMNPGLDWESIEHRPGDYDFSEFDKGLKRYYDAGKKVNIIVRPVSNGGVNHNTPDYVFTDKWAQSVGAPRLDVVTCRAYHGDGSRESGFPAVYEAPFKTAYKKFIAAVLQHYANNPHIGYIRFGLAVGGEAFAWCSDDLKSLRGENSFSKSRWLQYVEEMDAYEESLHPTMQLMAAINEQRDNAHNSWDMSYADEEARIAVAHGQGFGAQGWQRSDNDSYAAGQACHSDWCALFDKYAGKVPLELQQAGPSDPNGGNRTGLMSEIIPFAAAHHATILEIYIPDLHVALVPNHPAHAQYGEAWRKAMVNAHEGRATSK
jgi:hypothetical protein